MRSIHRLAVAGVCLALLASGVHAQSERLDAARAALQAGQYAQALATLDEILAASPRDAQARFLRGVVLAETDRVVEAIEAFDSLTEDHPELPEPHNNLAVLHAARGDYVRARDALLTAIDNHPSYATAHENLGDIYAKMAGLSYRRALELDQGNRTANAKLEVVDALFPGDATEVRAASPAPRPVAVAASPPPATPEPAAPESEHNPMLMQAVLDVVNGWARAWSAQDVDGYLAYYGAGFRPPKGASRAAWEAQRRSRLTRPSSIEVRISDARVDLLSAERADVTFDQSYRSDTYSDRVRKRLRVALTDQGWKIIDERTVQ